MPWSLDLDSAKRAWERGRDELGHAGAWLKSEAKDALQGGKELAQGLRDAVAQVATPEQAVAVAAKLADKLEQPIAALTDKVRAETATESHAADGARRDVTRLVAAVKDHATHGGVKRLAADALAVRAELAAGVGDVVGPMVSPMTEQSIAVGKALDGDLDGAKLHASVALGAVVHAAMPLEASGIDAYARAKQEGKAGVDEALKAAGSSLLAQLAAANPGFTATAAEVEGLRAGRSVLADDDPRGAGQHAMKAALHVAATVAAIVGADELTAATAAASDLERGAATRALSSEPNAVGKIKALEDVNRGYPQKPGTTTNCVNCYVATDATVDGNPVSALPSPVVDARILEPLYGTRFSTNVSYEQIVAHLHAAGPGSRVAVFGGFEDGSPGHVFMGLNENGTIHFVDGQRAEAGSFKHFDYLRILPTRNGGGP